MNMNKYILVTGGAGYIGSYMVRTLLENKYKPIIFDNLSTGHKELIPKNVIFIEGDLLKKEDIDKIFNTFEIDTVMHFAASAIVSESMSNPINYYSNNVSSSINLFKVMLEQKVKRLIFSSTCSVYGEPKKIPIRESHITNPTNPYGRSKLMIENILKDISSKCNFSYVSLRYFNVAGAHPSKEIGELHNPETHLIPNILKVIKRKKKELLIFGNNYPTHDGTCIRDYIHVSDICYAHLLALKKLKEGIRNEVFNLGNANGFSIMQVIEMAEKVTGKKVNFKIAPRRPGDPSVLIASSKKASNVLGWHPINTLEQIIESTWKWEEKIQ